MSFCRIHVVESDSLQDHLCFVTFAVGKRVMTSAEHKGYHSHAPHVTALVVSSVENLGSDVARSAENVLERSTFLEGAREAKVCELQGCVLAPVLHQVVLGLDVPVDDPVVMQVGYAGQHLPHESACLLDRQLCTGTSTSGLDGSGIRRRQHLCQRAASAKLHDQMHTFTCLEHLVQLHDVRMVKLPRDLQLIFKMTWILELVERNRLQGPQQPCPPVTDTVDDSVGALTQLFGRDVMILQKPLRFGNRV
mmetsp:Transcript_69634/g.166160  ORF Transcript_69634/g.166160 Transcript_69634/m.166160 type:complete len:250 (-) Transcript_69634:408-1157(-)